MKVLHIISSMNPQHGGTVSAVNCLIKAMDGLGHDSEIVTLDDSHEDFLQEIRAPITSIGPCRSRVSHIQALKEWIQNNAKRFDVAILHGLWNQASIGGWAGLRSAKLPYVIYPHGMMDPWFKKQYPLKHILKQLVWSVQGRALKNAQSVIFTSEEERRLAEGAFWGYNYRTHVLSLGIDPLPQFPNVDRSHLGKVLTSPDNKKYLLYLSRIHPKKGADLLIQAYADYANEYKDDGEIFDLVIAGPADHKFQKLLKRSAEELGISDKVHWPGMLQGEEKKAAFSFAEAFILPSHQENFGFVVPESLAHGTPVLITDKVNIWSKVVTNGAGIAEPDTVEGTKALLHKWSDLGSSGQSEMRRRAIECFVKYFTVDAIAKDLEAILQEAIIGKV
jgi:glycosyltransferase involved in cell wall biosynthesis